MDLAAGNDRLAIEELVERYGNQWIATARRSCSTSADAEDAYQRALEKLLTQPPAEDDPERIAAWMHTVIRNEALQIVRSQKREVDTEFDTIVDGLTADVALPAESLEDAESHGFAKEALRRLRPDQTRCLLLRADGFDYPEICAITGFSYAKVNRLLSEGRKAARTRVEAITGGRECERIEPLLSMIADGAADAAADHDARLHLENCPHCRATLRDYTLAPRDLAAAFPLGIVAATSWHARIFEPFHRLAEMLQGRAAGASSDSTIAVGKKALAVLAVGATVVGGGAVVEHQQSKDEKPATQSEPAKSAGPSAQQIAARRERASARKRKQAEARRTREARATAAAQAQDAAESPDAPTAAPLNAGAGADDGAAADPATDTAPKGANGTDGQAEGLAP